VCDRNRVFQLWCYFHEQEIVETAQNILAQHQALVVVLDLDDTLVKQKIVTETPPTEHRRGYRLAAHTNTWTYPGGDGGKWCILTRAGWVTFRSFLARHESTISNSKVIEGRDEMEFVTDRPHGCRYHDNVTVSSSDYTEGLVHSKLIDGDPRKVNIALQPNLSSPKKLIRAGRKVYVCTKSSEANRECVWKRLISDVPHGETLHCDDEWRQSVEHGPKDHPIKKSLAKLLKSRAETPFTTIIDDQSGNQKGSVSASFYKDTWEDEDADSVYEIPAMTEEPEPGKHGDTRLIAGDTELYICLDLLQKATRDFRDHLDEVAEKIHNANIGDGVHVYGIGHHLNKHVSLKMGKDHLPNLLKDDGGSLTQ